MMLNLSSSLRSRKSLELLGEVVAVAMLRAGPDQVRVEALF